MKYICFALIFVFVAAGVECGFYHLDRRVCSLSYPEKQQFGVCFRYALPANQQVYYREIQNCMKSRYRVDDDSYFFHYSECNDEARLHTELLQCLRERIDIRRMREDISLQAQHICQISTNCYNSIQREHFPVFANKDNAKYFDYDIGNLLPPC